MLLMLIVASPVLKLCLDHLTWLDHMNKQHTLRKTDTMLYATTLNASWHESISVRKRPMTTYIAAEKLHRKGIMLVQLDVCNLYFWPSCIESDRTLHRLENVGIRKDTIGMHNKKHSTAQHSTAQHSTALCHAPMMAQRLQTSDGPDHLAAPNPG